MFHIILGLHICLCFFLIGLVLLQQGSGADAGVTFGGGSSTVFGASGATSLFTRMTTIACILFMVTSVLLVKNYRTAVASGGKVIDPLKGSVMDKGVQDKEDEDGSTSSEEAGRAKPVSGKGTAAGPAKDNPASPKEAAGDDAPAPVEKSPSRGKTAP